MILSTRSRRNLYGGKKNTIRNLYGTYTEEVFKTFVLMIFLAFPYVFKAFSDMFVWYRAASCLLFSCARNCWSSLCPVDSRCSCFTRCLILELTNQSPNVPLLYGNYTGTIRNLTATTSTSFSKICLQAILHKKPLKDLYEGVQINKCVYVCVNKYIKMYT